MSHPQQQQQHAFTPAWACAPSQSPPRHGSDPRLPVSISGALCCRRVTHILNLETDVPERMFANRKTRDRGRRAAQKQSDTAIVTVATFDAAAMPDHAGTANSPMEASDSTASPSRDSPRVICAAGASLDTSSSAAIDAHSPGAVKARFAAKDCVEPCASVELSISCSTALSSMTSDDSTVSMPPSALLAEGDVLSAAGALSSEDGTPSQLASLSQLPSPPSSGPVARRQSIGIKFSAEDMKLELTDVWMAERVHVAGDQSDAGDPRLRQLRLRLLRGRSTLSNLTLQLDQGRMYAVVGRSSSGKASLLRLFGKVIQPSCAAPLLALSEDAGRPLPAPSCPPISA